MALLLLGQLQRGGFPILEGATGFMAIKLALKSIEIRTLFYPEEAITSLPTRFTSFYIFRFGYASVYRFIGSAVASSRDL